MASNDWTYSKQSFCLILIAELVLLFGIGFMQDLEIKVVVQYEHVHTEPGYFCLAPQTVLWQPINQAGPQFIREHMLARAFRAIPLKRQNLLSFDFDRHIPCYSVKPIYHGGRPRSKIPCEAAFRRNTESISCCLLK